MRERIWICLWGGGRRGCLRKYMCVCIAFFIKDWSGGWGFDRKWYYAVSEGVGLEVSSLNWTSCTVWVLLQSFPRQCPRSHVQAPCLLQGPWLLVQTQLVWWSLTSLCSPEGSRAWSQLGLLPSRCDRALFLCLLWDSTNHALQTLNLLYVVIFEEILTSGFYLFILYIYFAFVVCVCLVKIGLISLCDFHLKTGSQRLSLALNGAHLEGPPCTLSEISCWESCYLASIKSRLWSAIEEKNTIQAGLLPKLSQVTSIRPVYHLVKRSLWPPDDVLSAARNSFEAHGNCKRWQMIKWWHRVPQSDLGVNLHLSVRILGIIYVPVTI